MMQRSTVISNPAIRVALLLTTAANLHADEVVGPIVGTVDSTSAHILYRPAAQATRLRLTVSQDQSIVQQVSASSTAADDFVAKFAVTNLQPATTYSYQIDNDQGETLVEPNDNHSFKTVDPARKGKRVSAAFVSCVDIEPNGIWKDMDRLKVDAAFLMGDTPYIDSSDLEVVRDRHRRFLQMPDLAGLAAHTSLMGTWDDHDFGRNNGNGRNMQDEKADTLRGFREYRAHAQFGNGTEGVYHKVDLGMMEVFLLDPRYFSQTEPSPVDNKQPTCFGNDQWQWLLNGLRKSQAPFKVLALGAIWEDKKNKETDDMFTYWYERDALLDFIKAEKIAGVVLLGGDIHVARHLIHPERVGYDLHDFVISPGHTRVITKLDVYHPSLEWSLVEGWQFLTLTADGTSGSPVLTADFRQPNGVINRSVSIPLKEATSRKQPATSSQRRAHWSFDEDFTNDSVLNDRIDAQPVNGPKIVAEEGARGKAVRFDSAEEQYLTVPRSFLDDNSAAHGVSLRFKPTTLPLHGTAERAFLFESTAEDKPSKTGRWNLSLGFRATSEPSKINLQLYTHTLKPADRPEAAPTPISQGPFDTIVARDDLLNEWNELTYQFTSETLTLFLNGRKIAEHQLPEPGPASEFGGLIIGGHRDGTGRNFDGLIDELTIWQGARPTNDPARLNRRN